MAEIGPHRHVFEYDGSFNCLDCKGRWGAFPGNPVMPEECNAPAPAGTEGDICVECHKHRAEYCGYCLAKAERDAARGAAEEQRWADYDERHNF